MLTLNKIKPLLGGVIMQQSEYKYFAPLEFEIMKTMSDLIEEYGLKYFDEEQKRGNKSNEYFKVQSALVSKYMDCAWKLSDEVLLELNKYEKAKYQKTKAKYQKIVDKLVTLPLDKIFSFKTKTQKKEQVYSKLCDFSKSRLRALNAVINKRHLSTLCNQMVFCGERGVELQYDNFSNVIFYLDEYIKINIELNNIASSEISNLYEIDSPISITIKKLAKKYDDILLNHILPKIDDDTLLLCFAYYDVNDQTHQENKMVNKMFFDIVEEMYNRQGKQVPKGSMRSYWLFPVIHESRK